MIAEIKKIAVQGAAGDGLPARPGGALQELRRRFI